MYRLSDARETIKITLRTEYSGLSEQDREDIEQNALIKLHKAWDRLDTGNLRRVRSYVAVTAKNEAMSFLRAKRRRPKEVLIDVNYENESTLEIIGAASAENVEAQMTLVAFYESLQGNEKKYWDMRCKGLTGEEMSKREGLYPKSWARIGRKLLRKWYLFQQLEYE